MRLYNTGQFNKNTCIVCPLRSTATVPQAVKLGESIRCGSNH